MVVVESHRSAARYAARWHGAAAGGLVRFVSAASLQARRALFGLAGIISPAGKRRAEFYGRVAALSVKKRPALNAGN